MSYNYLLIFGTLIITSNCISNKKAQKMENTDPKSYNSLKILKTFDMYDVYIYFGSKASGPPSINPLISYLDTFENKYEVKINKIDKIGPLGREGEFALGFYLSNWKETTKKQFVDGIKKINWNKQNIPSAGYVVITENIPIKDINKPSRATISSFER